MSKWDGAATQVTHWSSRAIRRWFAKCDSLDHEGHRRNLVRDYFEGYDLSSPELLPNWMYICATCLVEELSDRLDTSRGERV